MLDSLVKQSVHLVLLTLLVGQMVAADLATSTGFIGHLGDGSGTWPADCQPVTTWNEYDLAWVVPKGAKAWQAVPKLKGEAHKNLVWRKDLVMSCHGGMIIAGGKLLLMRDRGGPHFSLSTAPVPFLGAELVCLDPASGNILWQHDCNHLDCLPDKVRPEVESGLRAWIDWYRIYRRAYDDWRRTTVRRVFKMKEHVAKHKPTDEGRRIWREGTSLFAKHAPGIPLDLDEVIAACADRTNPWKILAGITHNYAGPWALIAKKCGKAGPLIYYERSLGTYGYREGSWYGQAARCGSAFATPVSDGKHIYVQTGYMDAFCIDMDGNRVWSTWFGANSTQYGKMLASPVLLGDTLILVGGPSDMRWNKHLGKEMAARSPYKNWIRALDKNTGKQLWVAELPLMGYSNVSPVPLRLPLADGGTVDAIWTTSGNVYRASDGQLLAKDLGAQGTGKSVSFCSKRRIIVLNNGIAAGGHGKPKGFPVGMIAIQLQADAADQVTAALLWKHASDAGLVMGDHVFVDRKQGSRRFLQVRDLMSGNEVAVLPISVKRGGFASHCLVGAGGRYVFALDGKQNGHCLVFDVGNPTQPVLAAVNLLGKERAWSQGSVPSFSGNRMFVRNETAVYCIGDPDQALQLSTVHR